MIEFDYTHDNRYNHSKEKVGRIMTNYLFENDRNFNDDLKDETFYYVVEHNDLITKANHDLTARELKIMDYVISKIKPDDKAFNVVHTSLYELNNILGLTRTGKNYSDMAQSIGTLRKKEVLILDEQERTITQTGWVESAKYHENGQVEIRLSTDLAPYLLELKKDYTQYLLFDTVQLNSKYSIILYKLMREADKRKGKVTPVLETTPEVLQKQLGSPESYTFGDFNRNVLKPAIEEINLKIDDMNLTVVQGRRGRKVVALKICNEFYPIKKTSDDSIEPVPMIDWMKDFK